MFKRNILIFAIIVAFLSVAFIISFNYGMKKYGGSNDKYGVENTIEDDPGKYAANLTLGDKVSPNAKAYLKVLYKKSGETVIKEAKVSDFAGKTKLELEQEGYEVESISSDSLTLLKVIDSYSPNKYVLGIKDNCFAIYKTDENGNMYIEDAEKDITDIEIPTEGDYELLTKGSSSFQFDTREAVEEKLGEYDS